MAAVVLDLAAWSVLRHVPLLHRFGLAPALALCFVHPFVLPPLFGRPWAGVLRTVGQVGIGILAAPFALLVGFGIGANVGALGFLVMLWLSPATSWLAGAVGISPDGPTFDAVRGAMITTCLLIGFAVGTTCAALAATGFATLCPGAWRQRPSWRVVLAGAWSSVLVAVPDHGLAGLGRWHEPALLLLAAVPVAALLNQGGITRHSAFEPSARPAAPPATPAV